MPDAPHLVDREGVDRDDVVREDLSTPRGAAPPAASGAPTDLRLDATGDDPFERVRVETATAAIALLGSGDGGWRDHVTRIAQRLGHLRDARRSVVLIVVAVAVLACTGAWFLLRPGAPAVEPLPFTKKRATPTGTDPGAGQADQARRNGGRGGDEVGSPSGRPGRGGAEQGDTASGGPTAARGAGGTTVATVWADVTGAVLRPGLVPLAEGARLAEAIAAAGGLAPDADRDRVNLAGRVRDGERVYVPRRGEQSAPSVVAGGTDGSGQATGAAPGGAGGSRAPATAPAGPLDLNTATAEQLDTLPGIGPATAAAIIDYRTQHGPFQSVDELDQVRGLGTAKVEQLRSHVRVGP